ncbi:hypothetical protein GN958_ATG09730, partial [Phytophthora infestans]
WCTDNAANVHVTWDLRFYTQYSATDHKEVECVRGFHKKFATAPFHHGAVRVVFRKGRVNAVFTLRMNPTSEIERTCCRTHSWKTRDTTWNITVVAETEFISSEEAKIKFSMLRDTTNDVLPEVITVLHYQVAKTNLLLRKLISQPDGAADLQRWHERLGHLCPISFADLLFSHRSCRANAEKAVLVVVDGYTRFTTVYPLKSNTTAELSAEMQRYKTWAGRQLSGYPVLKAITDNFGEFGRGIALLPNPPCSSHLKRCERAHQTLATFLRSRSYHTVTKDTPYHLMIRAKTNMHRIWRFESIALTRASELRILWGTGGSSWIPDISSAELTFQHVLHVSINEEIVYKDRYQDNYSSLIFRWLSNVDCIVDKNAEEAVFGVQGAEEHVVDEEDIYSSDLIL